MSEEHSESNLDRQIEDSPMHAWASMRLGDVHPREGIQQWCERAHIPASIIPFIHEIVIARGEYEDAFLLPDENVSFRTQIERLQAKYHALGIPMSVLKQAEFMYAQLDLQYQHHLSYIYTWAIGEPDNPIHAVASVRQITGHALRAFEQLVMLRERFPNKLVGSNARLFKQAAIEGIYLAIRHTTGRVRPGLPEQVFQNMRDGAEEVFIMYRQWRATLQ